MERDSRKRAEALLAQMTATEKVGQLNQHLYGFRIYHVEDGKIIFTQELKDEVKSGAGSARSMVFTVQIHGRKKIMRQGLPGDFPCRHIISYRNM